MRRAKAGGYRRGERQRHNLKPSIPRCIVRLTRRSGDKLNLVKLNDPILLFYVLLSDLRRLHSRADLQSLWLGIKDQRKSKR